MLVYFDVFLVRSWFLVFQARECAEAMEADMYKRFHPEDEVRNFGDELHNGNPLKIPRTACVLDPRTKTCLWADDDDMEE